MIDIVEDRNQILMVEDKNLISIHKHSFVIQKPAVINNVKHFVFDLDETIGSFTELYLLWSGLKQLKHQEFQETIIYFSRVLDLYPEFLRYGIVPIFQYLYKKKEDGFCKGIHIYTNNNCNPPWVELLQKYIENLGQMPNLFDQIISSFKIGSKRTTYAKTLGDFFRCTLLPKNIEICFVDNTYFPKMRTGKVFYIQPKSYYHSLTLDEILNRFIHSDLGKNTKCASWETQSWKDCMKDWFYENGYQPVMKTTQERNEDIFVSKRLIYHIKDFFYLTIRKQKTRKNRNKFWLNNTKKRTI